MIAKPIAIKAEKKYLLTLKYDDGLAGTLDLSYLALTGVFNQWEENDLFFHPYIDAETSAICWNKTLELSSDALYLKLKGITFDEWKNQTAHATVK